MWGTTKPFKFTFLSLGTFGLLLGNITMFFVCFNAPSE